METVILNRVCGFKTVSPVTVYSDGIIFYQYTARPGQIVYFNLPPGSYQVEQILVPVSVRKYKYKRLSKPEKKLVPYPGELNVNITDNPNKASIDIKTAQIYLDKELSFLPSWCLKWVLYHELGHYYYFDERKCDHFAEVQMLRSGFNPSQIDFATGLILKSGQRRLACTKHLERV